MAETEATGKPATKPPGPDVEIPPKDVEIPNYKKLKKCPKCQQEFHPKAGAKAKEVHVSQCQGSEGPLFQDNPRKREKEVIRPPKKELFACPCGARFYAGTVYCPGCGEEIEW